VGSLHTSNDNKDKDTGFRVVDAVRAAFGRVGIARTLSDKRAGRIILPTRSCLSIPPSQTSPQAGILGVFHHLTPSSKGNAVS